MPKHYLIPYVPIKGHIDPDFKELAYGDSGQRGKALKDNLSKGSYLFFHTKIGSEKYITGYIVVDRILSKEEAQANLSLDCDGRDDDWLFVGNRRKSKRLRKPIPLNKQLAQKLSLNIDFRSSDSGRKTELSVIGSATRPHRRLTENDVSILLREIEKYEENAKFENPEDVQRYLNFEVGDAIPFDEVYKLKESQIQKLLRKTPFVIEKGVKVKDYEKVLPDGDRLDLLLEAADGSLIVAELKGPNKLPNEITTQVASYARDIEKEFPKRKIRKMIICDGKLSPKLKKACISLGIEIVVYGVKLDCFKLE